MKLFVSLLALFILPGSAVACWNGILFTIHNHQLLRYLLIGMGIGALLYFLFIRRWNYFLTFEHELTHAFMCMLFFRRIRRFVVTRHNGGVVYHSGDFGGEFGNVMITLAPYFFPTFTIIGLLFQPLIPQKYYSFYLVLLGFTFIFHHLSTIRELKNNWNSSTFSEAGSGESTNTDIDDSGFVFSFIFIVTMTLLMNALVLWFLKFSYGGFIPMFKAILVDSLSVFKAVFSKAMQNMSSIQESLATNFDSPLLHG